MIGICLGTRNGDRIHARKSKARTHRRAQERQHFRQAARPCSAGIFAKDDIPHPMAAVFDMPVLVPKPQQAFWRRSEWVEAGNGIMCPPDDQSGVQHDASVFDAEYLCNLRPPILGLEVGVECCGRAQAIGFQTTVPFDAALASRRGCPGALGRAGKPGR